MMDCVIFDCDGTLVDSEFICHLAMQKKLEDIGVSEPAENMMLKFRGAKLANIIADLEKKHKIILNDDFITAYRDLVSRMFQTDLYAVDGVKQVLDNINKKVCVASSGPLAKIQQALEVTKLDAYFKNNLFSSYEINSWKPEPDLFLFAAKKMNSSPKHCYVVEDSPVGIEAALAANMKAIYFNPQGETIPGVISITKMESLIDILS